MDTLALIIEKVTKLQKENPAHHVKFMIFDDCSGAFGYYDSFWEVDHEIQSWDSIEELLEILNN